MTGRQEAMAYLIAEDILLEQEQERIRADFLQLQARETALMVKSREVEDARAAIARSRRQVERGLVAR